MKQIDDTKQTHQHVDTIKLKIILYKTLLYITIYVIMNLLRRI